MPQQTPISFDIKMYGDLVPYELNPSMSKARVSIFRKYANANGSYFTDEVADQMVKNLGGCPIVGCYDQEKKDFTSHLTINDTRAYGFIPPENYNFAWQTRTENDGKEYQYACFDIVLWTDRYEEAKEIVNKGQSMQLNPYKTFGNWQEKDGELNFVYTSTTIYGLCVLGDSVRPCFDAACFYTQNQQQISSFMEAIKAEIKNNFSYANEKNDGGNEEMPEETLETPLEDSQLQNAPETPEQPQVVEEQPDTPAPAVEEENKEENTSTSFSQEELDKAVSEAVAAVEANYTAKIAEMQTKLDEYAAANYEAQIEQLKSELATYQSKEAEHISAQKDELIASYSDCVDSDLLEDVKSNKDNFSLDEIEAKLAVNFSRAMRKKETKVLTNVMEDDATLEALHRHMQNKRGNN